MTVLRSVLRPVLNSRRGGGGGSSADNIYSIGEQGELGFGVAPCKTPPPGYTPMPGCSSPTGPRRGNYVHSGGSHLVWIPAYYMRVGSPLSPLYATYGANAVDIADVSAFPTEIAAAAQDFYLHDAFRHAGAVQPGFFYGKYKASNLDGKAASVPMAMPMTAYASGDSPFSALDATPANNLAGAIEVCRTIGPEFFPATAQMRHALAVLSLAHGQAAAGTDACAWFDNAGLTNFPKGCNNNALGDADDNTLSFVSAGGTVYPTLPFTGSGSNFAKTTHNGQESGVADVNGTVFDVNIGVTCTSTYKTITGATKANPVVLTVVGHGCQTGDRVNVVSVAGMTEINDRVYTLTVIDDDTFSLDGVDGTGFTAYTSGGVARVDIKFWAIKPDVDLTTVTGGVSLITDLWSPAGIAAMYDEVDRPMETAYPANTNTRRVGNGTDPVMLWSDAGQRRTAMVGFPAAYSPGGTAMFGADYDYQYVVNQLGVLSGGGWNYSGNAGVWSRSLGNPRASSVSNSGCVPASYLP